MAERPSLFHMLKQFFSLASREKLLRPRTLNPPSTQPSSPSSAPLPSLLPLVPYLSFLSTSRHIDPQDTTSLSKPSKRSCPTSSSPPSTQTNRTSQVPSPPSHPLKVLLASKGFHRLVFPYLYQSISILRSIDWITLFSKEDRILGAKEIGLERVRVMEVFVRQDGGTFVWVPWDLKGGKESLDLVKGPLGNRDSTCLLLSNLGTPLPHVHSVFILPSKPSPTTPSELERLTKLLKSEDFLLPRSLSKKKRSHERAVVDTLLAGDSIQNAIFASLNLHSLPAYVLHPLDIDLPDVLFRFSKFTLSKKKRSHERAVVDTLLAGDSIQNAIFASLNLHSLPAYVLHPLDIDLPDVLFRFSKFSNNATWIVDAHRVDEADLTLRLRRLAPKMIKGVPWEKEGVRWVGVEEEETKEGIYCYALTVR